MLCLEPLLRNDLGFMLIMDRVRSFDRHATLYFVCHQGNGLHSQIHRSGNVVVLQGLDLRLRSLRTHLGRLLLTKPNGRSDTEVVFLGLYPTTGKSVNNNKIFNILGMNFS